MTTDVTHGVASRAKRRTLGPAGRWWRLAPGAALILTARMRRTRAGRFLWLAAGGLAVLAAVAGEDETAVEDRPHAPKRAERELRGYTRVRQRPEEAPLPAREREVAEAVRRAFSPDALAAGRRPSGSIGAWPIG